MATFYERVVGVWDDELGTAVGGAGVCGEWEFAVDV